MIRRRQGQIIIGILTVSRTSKNAEGISYPKVFVATAKTPMGMVNPHQPLLKMNLDLDIEARARTSQTSPKPYMMSAIRNPATYRICPAFGFRIWSTGKIFKLTEPSFMMPKLP